MRHAALALVCLGFGVSGCKGEQRRPLAETVKACAHEGELGCPRPIFNVRSLRASQSYYRDVLGFKVDWDYGDPPTFGSVSRDHAILFMCEGCQGSGGAWVWMFAADVDRLYREFRAKQARVRMPPTDMPWGVREMQVADPDGNVMRFASPLDH